VAVVIGDVAGRGVAAASMMGQLRSALRAYALEGARPPWCSSA
jgi:serine phosphatase RsbU (regulator of sigma subunit)